MYRSQKIKIKNGSLTTSSSLPLHVTMLQKKEKENEGATNKCVLGTMLLWNYFIFDRDFEQ